MFRKLVKYDKWHFAEVDPVRLKRKAIILREQILSKINPASDPYQFYCRTLPIVDAAIKGEIISSLDRNVTKYIGGNFRHDENEGELPIEYDDNFTNAVAGFAVAVEGFSLEQLQYEVVDGVTYAWMNCEEESDWPDKMSHP